MRTNEPEMNIVNQINAALADVRETLVSLASNDETPNVFDARDKAVYQLKLAILMIYEYRQRNIRVPWSERKHQVDEEFS